MRLSARRPLRQKAIDHGLARVSDGGKRMEDSQIIDLFFERNEQAIVETQAKYDKLCRKIAGGILVRPEDADEALNTSYLKLWNAIPPKRPESLCGYICMIVRNTALNFYDTIHRRSYEELYGELADVLPDDSTFDEKVESSRVSECLNAFLKACGKKNRDIFVGRYYFNMTLKDIARGMGMTETAVKTRLSRTRQRLKKYLGENGISV